MRRAWPARERLLENRGPGVIREEPEFLDPRAINGHRRRPDRARHVEQASVSAHDHIGTLEEGAGGDQRELTGRTGDPVPLSPRQPSAEFPLGRPAEHDQIVRREQEVDQSVPVRFGPAFREVRRAGNQGDQSPGPPEPVVSEESIGRQLTLARQKELRWRTIGDHVEPSCRFEITIGDRAERAAEPATAGDQHRAADTVLGIGRPLTADLQAESTGAERIVEIEPVGPGAEFELTHQAGERRPRPPGDDPVEPGIVAQGIGHVFARDKRQPSARMSCAEGTQQRRRQDQVPDGREPQEKDVGLHARS